MAKKDDFDNLTVGGTDVATATDVDAKADSDGGGTATLTNYASVDTAEARITRNADFTISVPTDYATVQAALNDLAERRFSRGIIITINIESGHTITEPISCRYSDYSHVRIESTDATVPVGSSFPTGEPIISAARSFAPILACSIDAGGYGDDGLVLDGLSMANVGGGSGVINASGAGLRVDNGSTVLAWASDFHGSGEGVIVQKASRADFGASSESFADLTGSGGTGLLVQRASSVRAHTTDFSGATDEGILVQRGASVDAQSAVVSNCDIGILAQQSGTANANGVTADGCGTLGLRARNGGRISADRCSVTNSANQGVRAEHMSQVDLEAATVTGSANDDLYCYRGSFINATGVTTTSGSPAVADTNVGSFNSLSSNGVIFSG